MRLRRGRSVAAVTPPETPIGAPARAGTGANGGGAGARWDPLMRGRTRKVGAVSILVGAMALSGCLQDARARAEERALDDAAFEYASAK